MATSASSRPTDDARRGDWMARLDEALLARTHRPLGSTCSAASWGELGRPLPSTPPAWPAPCWWPLLTPSGPDMPPSFHNWKPIRRPRLLFLSIAVVSTDDPYCSLEWRHRVHQAWGSRVVVAGPRGHLTANRAPGDRPRAARLLTPCGREGGPRSWWGTGCGHEPRRTGAAANPGISPLQMPAMTATCSLSARTLRAAL